MYISLPSSRRSHFPRCPKTMTRYKYINDLYRSYMCAHPHALCLGLGDGYHIPLWPNNADLSLYILDGSLTVYIRLDCICIKCQTWLFFPFFSVFLSLFHAQKNKKTKHCRIPCIVVWCIILVGAWQAMSYVAVASHGGQTIHSNLNVSVNRKDASFWRSNGIQPHERGGNVHKNIREEGKVGDWENKETRRFLPGIWWIVTFGERVNDVSIIENDTGKAMRSTFGLRGIARHSLSTTTDESRKGNEQNNQKQKMGKWKTFQTTERVTTGEITIDKLLVSTIIKVCTYVVYTAPPQLLVAVTTRSTRKFGCRPCCWDCASTVGWESNIQSHSRRHRELLGFPRLHSSTDNHGNRTEILGIHYLSLRAKLTFQKME